MRSDPNALVRIAAAIALCRIEGRTEASVAAMRTAVRESDPRARVAVYEALWQWTCDVQALRGLVDVLEGPDYQATREAEAFLIQTGPAAKAVVPDLLKRLKNTQSRAYYTLLNLLETVDPDAARNAGLW
jgi:hypothetical protein